MTLVARMVPKTTQTWACSQATSHVTVFDPIVYLTNGLHPPPTTRHMYAAQILLLSLVTPYGQALVQPDGNDKPSLSFDVDESLLFFIENTTLPLANVPITRQRRFPTSAPASTNAEALPTIVPTTSLPAVTPGFRYPRCSDAAARGCLDAWSPCCPLGDGKAAGISCGKSNCDPARDIRGGETCFGGWMRKNCQDTCGLCTEGGAYLFKKKTTPYSTIMHYS